MDIFEKLANFCVVPVISLEREQDALPLADSLIEAGLPVAEITFRTKAAAKAIEQIAHHRPDMLIGAGTVLDEEQAKIAKDCGAMFALSPGIDASVLKIAAEIALPFAPGIMTPSELQIALRHGCKLVKFYPAVASGGPAMLKNIAGPYLHTGIRFNPTGGISLDNMADWLSLESVNAVGGTWIAKQDDIMAGKWDTIRQNAAEALAKARSL